MTCLELIQSSCDADQTTADRPRVLVLTHRLPYPPDRGDRIRAYHLLRELSKATDLSLGAVSEEPTSETQRLALSRLVRTACIAQVAPWAARRSAGMALLTGRPLTPSALFRTELAKHLIDQNKEQPFDVVVTFCSGMLSYAKALLDSCNPNARPRHILDLVDVDSLKWTGFAQASRGPMRLVYATEARRLRKAEAGGLVPFDAVTVISQQERQAYRDSVTDAIDPVVAGNGVDLDRFSPPALNPPPSRHPTIVFTGVLSYKPNIDAVTRFARQVMPRVLAAVPEARFDIVGKSPSPVVRALDELPGVQVVGEVPDTAVHLQAATVVVAPMRIAPGVQNKVLEAMACGRAVVCSPAAAAGIDAIPDKHLLVADSDRDTASQVAALLLNPAKRQTLGQAARQRVEDRYHWQAQLQPLLDLILQNRGRVHAIQTRPSQHAPALHDTL